MRHSSLKTLLAFIGAGGFGGFAATAIREGLEAPANAEPPAASVPVLTNDSQIGSDLRVWADEDDRTDFDQQR